MFFFFFFHKLVLLERINRLNAVQASDMKCDDCDLTEVLLPLCLENIETLIGNSASVTPYYRRLANTHANSP